MASGWGRTTGKFGPRQYSFAELAEATDRFSYKHLIGQGGFGQVYKGFLGGEILAIKKLKYESGQTEEESEKEIMVYSRVRHRNIVNLVGYCIESNITMIVLEYIPNRSLRYHLHGGEEILDWQKRIQIAKGVAKGLEYLHEHCNPRIIHRDIKPDNILLDNDFQPKIADLGIALFFPDNVTYLSEEWMGTNVYADVEQLSKGVSEKLDVYSFGVVLLELITGRKCIYEDIDIVNWAKDRITQALRGEHTFLVDPKLQNYNKEEMKRMISCAAECVYKPSELRPQMKEIVQTLEEYILPVDMDANGNNFLLGASIGPIRYSYKQLSKATGNFSNNFSLGQGSFGQVYKGYLDDGICAIKKLFYPKGFEDEIKFLSCVRHRNLVAMVGYCMEEANALIVLEYLPNKSLRSHLHESKSLDWPKRMKIAIGSAKGLEYLHEHCNPKIIHQDIKPDNILLDNNFEPKVADFGLSSFLPDTASHFSVSTIRGTDVYIDLEHSGKVSNKSDVYSFGVVLLELITGRKPIDEDIRIVHWAKTRIIQALKEESVTFVDSNLQDYDGEEMKRMIFCAASCIYKPLNCRPTMKKIVQTLEQDTPLKDIWDDNDYSFLHDG